MRTGAGFTPTGGGGGVLAVDTDVLGTSTQHIADTRDAIVSRVNNLMSQLDGLDKSTWDGEAAQAFLNAKLRWHDNHQSIVKSLTAIIDNLTTGKTGYVNSESTSAGDLQKVVSGLG
jgi:WXG100 family type VII secretion target